MQPACITVKTLQYLPSEKKKIAAIFLLQANWKENNNSPNSAARTDIAPASKQH